MCVWYISNLLTCIMHCRDIYKVLLRAVGGGRGGGGGGGPPPPPPPRSLQANGNDWAARVLHSIIDAAVLQQLCNSQALITACMHLYYNSMLKFERWVSIGRDSRCSMHVRGACRCQGWKILCDNNYYWGDSDSERQSRVWKYDPLRVLQTFLQ